MLVVFIVLTPLSVAWDWPAMVSAVLLFAVIVLLLFAGPDDHLPAPPRGRRPAGRRRPLASDTKTVGELEDEAADGGARRARPTAASGRASSDPVRQ